MQGSQHISFLNKKREETIIDREIGFQRSDGAAMSGAARRATARGGAEPMKKPAAGRRQSRSVERERPCIVSLLSSEVETGGALGGELRGKTKREEVMINRARGSGPIGLELSRLSIKTLVFGEVRLDPALFCQAA